MRAVRTSSTSGEPSFTPRVLSATDASWKDMSKHTLGSASHIGKYRGAFIFEELGACTPRSQVSKGLLRECHGMCERHGDHGNLLVYRERNCICESGCAYHGITVIVTNLLMKVQHVALSENSVHSSFVLVTVIWTWNFLLSRQT